jgi:hypothetical protein
VRRVAVCCYRQCHVSCRVVCRWSYRWSRGGWGTCSSALDSSKRWKSGEAANALKST